MKILYVEDELAKNIPGIIRLFRKYLNEKQIKELEAFEHDQSGYGALSAEIKTCLEATQIIEVEYRFPEALNKILCTPEKYALFLVDRNLSGSEYTQKEVQAIDPNYHETLHKKYAEREGDYLLEKLAIFSPVDVMAKFYFLTAYSARDELRSGQEIEHLIEIKKFAVSNFIEKGNSRDFERLQQMMTTLTTLNVRSDNLRYLNILATYCDRQTVEDFVKILTEKDDARGLTNAPNEIRKIYEKLLGVCLERIPGAVQYLQSSRSTVLGTQTINWLKDQGHIKTIHNQFLFALRTITNELSHTHHEHLSTDTVNALVYMLKEMIVWCDGMCRKYPQHRTGSAHSNSRQPSR